MSHDDYDDELDYSDELGTYTDDSDEEYDVYGTEDYDDAAFEEEDEYAELGAAAIVYTEFFEQLEGFKGQLETFLNLANIYVAAPSMIDVPDLRERAEVILFNMMSLCEALGLCTVHEIVVTSEEDEE